MRLKELTLAELLALFDASAHEKIVSMHGDPEVRHIVVFANHFQPDLGLLAVGPNQECRTLGQAQRAVIERKFAKFVVRGAHFPAGDEDERAAGLVSAGAPPPPPPPVSTPDAAPASFREMEADLRRREEDVLERENYVTNAEEALMDKIREIERRTVELDQREENLERRAAR